MYLIDTETPHSIGYTNENNILINFLMPKRYLHSVLNNNLIETNIITQFLIAAINEKRNHDNFIIFNSYDNRRIKIFIDEILCEFYDPSLNSRVIKLNLLSLIFLELLNVIENEKEKDSIASYHTAIVPILKYIKENFNTCTLESIAKYFNMNPNYLTTLLKKSTGNSYKELVMTQRLNHAAELLRSSDIPISEIIHLVGYKNMSFFYKKFQEIYGDTPKSYRENN